MLLIIISFVGMVCHLRIAIYLFFTSTMPQIIIDCGLQLMFLLFTFVSFKYAFSHGKLWIDFFTKIEEFDGTMEGHRVILEENVYTFLLKFLICHSFYVITDGMLYLSMKRYGFFVRTANGIYCHLRNYQIIMTVLVLENISKMLQRRYEFLKLKTVEVFMSPYNKNKFWNGQLLKLSHLRLVSVVNIVNQIFGLKILLLLSVSFLQILNAFAIFVLSDRILKFMPKVWINFGVQTMVLWVSSTTSSHSEQNAK